MARSSSSSDEQGSQLVDLQQVLRDHHASVETIAVAHGIDVPTLMQQLLHDGWNPAPHISNGSSWDAVAPLVEQKAVELRMELDQGRLHRQQEERDFEELKRQYGGVVMAALHDPRYRLSAQDIEDLVQETWMKVWNARNSFQVGRSYPPWLRTIARNVAIDHLKKRARRRETPTRDGTPEDKVAPLPEIDPDLIEAMIKRMDRLDPRTHAMINDRFFSGLTWKDIATEYGGDPSTCCHRVMNALEELRQQCADLLDK